MSPPHIADVARAVGVAAGLMAVGAAAGVVAERAVVAKAGRADREGDEPFGHLRGQPLTVESDGTMLHVEVEPCTRANPEGITVVFCHGYALNQDCWHYQRRDLRALGDLVFWDQRSHGRSGRSVAETNTIDQLGRDLKVVLDTVAPTGPIVLVGHSMGGMTIMQLALDHPELFGSRIRGVALLSTSPGGIRDISLGLPPHGREVAASRPSGHSRTACAQRRCRGDGSLEGQRPEPAVHPALLVRFIRLSGGC